MVPPDRNGPTHVSIVRYARVHADAQARTHACTRTHARTHACTRTHAQAHTHARTRARTRRYFVEILTVDYSCFDAAEYAALLVVDPEQVCVCVRVCVCHCVCA